MVERGVALPLLEAMKDTLKFVTVIVLLVAVVAGSVAWKLHIWKLEHPTTPQWVFWLKG
jgi:hypothetical protein